MNFPMTFSIEGDFFIKTREFQKFHILKLFQYNQKLGIFLSFYYVYVLAFLKYKYSMTQVFKRNLYTKFFIMTQGFSIKSDTFLMQKSLPTELLLKLHTHLHYIQKKKISINSSIVLKTQILQNKNTIHAPYYKNIPIYYFWYIDSFFLQLNSFFLSI